MKRLLYCAALLIIGAGCPAAPEATCDVVTVDDASYCVYRGAITETGYDCPADMPHLFRDEDRELAVCSTENARPPFEAVEQAWEEQIAPERNNIGLDPGHTNGQSNNQNTNTAVVTTAAELCADPQAFDGSRIQVSASDVSEAVGSSLVDCGGCCNSAFTDFVLECEGSEGIVLMPSASADWPSALGRQETSAAAGLSQFTTQMGCIGQECYQICAPGRLSEISSFTGVFRTGQFSSQVGDLQYPMGLEVEDFERAGDGCPDFASECPSGCTPILGRQYDEANSCVGELQTIGCSAAELGTNNLGCIQRAANTYRYEIGSESLPEDTDWLTCETSELPAWPDCE